MIPYRIIKISVSLLWILATTSLVSSQARYVGTTMNFTDYLEKRCGIIFKENGIPTDPFQSLANHGANIVRLTVALPPFSSSYSEGQQVDHHSAKNVKIGLQRAQDAGLKTLLTFSYRSYALEDEDHQNIYVAPKAWQEISLDLDKITDSVYHHTYTVLDEYCNEGLFPEIVSIGNESSWHRLMPSVPEDELPNYDPARSVAIHNAGSKAVRDISIKYDTVIKVCFHMLGPAATKWWLATHWPYGPDLDIISISLYHGWNDNDYGGYPSLGDYVAGIIGTYGIEFLVMETAQLFTDGGSDAHVDILGTENIPAGYPNPPTTETQKQYLVDITQEVLDHGGSGVIVWGGEWVSSDCYIYADQWGKGSSWENKAFWDFDYNLHDGVNWMMAFSGKVPVTFKVDMSGFDTSEGVYIAGEFENFQGEMWVHNLMQEEGNNIYYFTAYVQTGTSGSYFFLNDTLQPGRENVPAACADSSGINRIFTIPASSTGEIFAHNWSTCDPIPQYNLSVIVTGNGTVSPVKAVYSSGIIVNMVAVPGEGWLFSGWTGDTTSMDNPFQFRINAEMHLTANFITKPAVPVTFKVDMNGVDVSNGVYATGEFPNKQGKTWQLNWMTHEGNQIYSYDTEISTGSSGAYYFLNDDVWGVRESVPSACAEHWGVDRGYEIPLNSSGETFAFVWSSCEEIGPVSAFTPKASANENLFEIYPNPVLKDQLFLAFKVTDRANITILDLQGRMLFENTTNCRANEVTTIDLDQYPKGAFLIRVYFPDLQNYDSKLFFIHSTR